MPVTYQYLTDRTLASNSAITTATLIHIVDPNDVTQNPDGSSYKANLSQLLNVFAGSGDTYWTSGTTGTFSIKTKNTSGLDATGNYAVASGFNTKATGQYSFAEGFGTSATTLTSHSEGQLTLSSGVGSHSEGRATVASGSGSHAEGQSTISSGNASHAEGGSTIASGTNAHSEGGNTFATASYTHSEGYQTSATTIYAHSEGDNSLASGQSSHAEGSGTVSSGIASHAQNRTTTASGSFSHAGGRDSIASGSSSFIHSYNSLVTGDRSAILGGQNITGTTNDTVYVPYFNIGYLATGTSINKLGIDSSGNVVSAATETFTGNTSATCITDIFVTNVNSCSPLHIQPVNSGDVYISESGGNVGIGTTSATQKLHVSGNTLISGTLSATTISATTLNAVGNTISGTKGTINLSGSASTAFLTFSGSNTVGGTGYTDFIRVTNTAAGALTPSKTLRIDSLGSFEIINNAYNSNILSLTDSGNLTVVGRLKGSVNYSQTGGGASVILANSASPQTILSTTITTYGNPVMVCAYGDAENTGAGYWSKLQFWRDSTAIGAIVHTEGSAASENSPFALTYIDNPTAGTYTYYLKANEISGGNIKFGESTAPILNVREL